MLIGKWEMVMPHYNLWRKDDDKKDHTESDSYWILASSSEEARRLMALNISEAFDARDSDKFECEVNTSKTPPSGLIYRRLCGPVSITKRSSHA